MSIFIERNGAQKWGILVMCTGKGNSFSNARKGILPCKSIMWVKADDLFQTLSGGNYAEPADTVNYTCSCPNCGAYTDISPWRIPSKIKDYVNYKPSRSNDYGDER